MSVHSAPSPERNYQGNEEDNRQIHVGHKEKYLLMQRSFPGVGSDELADHRYGRKLLYAMRGEFQRLGQVAAGVVPSHVQTLLPESALCHRVDFFLEGKPGRISFLAIVRGKLLRGEAAAGSISQNR